MFRFTIAIIAWVALCMAPVWAESSSYQAAEAMNEVREQIVDMIVETDHQVYAHQCSLLDAASDEVDYFLKEVTLNRMYRDYHGTVDEVNATWSAFKQTQYQELVPALKAGDTEGARVLAVGVQRKRFQKMVRLLYELEKAESHAGLGH